MSRIGRRPIPIPQGVEIKDAEGEVRVKGPKGQLSWRVPARIDVAIEDGRITVSRGSEQKAVKALHGLSRALIANMVHGVSTGFSKELEIIGVGYRAEAAGRTLKLVVGYSHPVEMTVPEGLSVSVDRNVVIKVEGISKEAVGQFAAEIRRVRPPEPYKGKGIRYLGERMRRKVGKAAVG